jgi:hypothetical protein
MERDGIQQIYLAGARDRERISLGAAWRSCCHYLL